MLRGYGILQVMVKDKPLPLKTGKKEMTPTYSVEQMRVAISQTIENEIKQGADTSMVKLLELVFSEYLLFIQRKAPSHIIK